MLHLAEIYHKVGFTVRAELQNCFCGAADAMDVGLVAANLIDSGFVDVVVACDDASAPSDPYDIEEVVEQLLWLDVEGETMLERTGFRAAPGVEGLEAVERLASAFKITRFDVADARELPKVLAVLGGVEEAPRHRVDLSAVP